MANIGSPFIFDIGDSFETGFEILLTFFFSTRARYGQL